MTPAAAPDPHFAASGEHIPPPFSIERLPAPDGVMLLVLEGEMDMASADRFRGHGEEAVDSRPQTLVLDVTDVVFMDSSMLKELLRTHAEVSGNGGAVILAGLQPAVRRLLELTRTSELFRLADTREAALAAAT
jgi:anti-sigma B factor antagonist